MELTGLGPEPGPGSREAERWLKVTRRCLLVHEGPGPWGGLDAGAPGKEKEARQVLGHTREGRGREESSTCRGGGGAWSSETACPSPQCGGLHRVWGAIDFLGHCVLVPGPWLVRRLPLDIHWQTAVSPSSKEEQDAQGVSVPGRPALCGLSWERREPPRPHLRSVHALT